MEPRFFKRGNGRASLTTLTDLLIASMEPRFFKRGNAINSKNFCVSPGSFNGATFFQTWKCRLREPLLFVCGQRFNGATFFQTWKLKPIWRKSSANGRASMEPRFFKRGNPLCPGCNKRKMTRFNGATFFQTWKSGEWNL